jgi:transcriptional regulator with XRE-family HTH domain
MSRVDRQFDVEVGRKIKELRLARGLSQTTLADALGITYQQFAKYERGVNRISAAQIHLLAHVLDCPISAFFDGLPQIVTERPVRIPRGVQPAAA